MFRPLTVLIKLSAAAIALAATSASVSAAEQDLDSIGAKFHGATAFTRQVVGSPVRKGYLFFYHSNLGEALRLRPVAQDELDEMRRVCHFMQRTVAESGTGSVDDYFLEFASGEGDPATIPEEKRFVFRFTREGGCDADPTPISLR